MDVLLTPNAAAELETTEFSFGWKGQRSSWRRSDTETDFAMNKRRRMASDVQTLTLAGKTFDVRGCILVHLLPYIEQQTLYDMYDFGNPGGVSVDNQTMPGTAQLIQSNVISTYLCPSDPNPQVVGGRALHCYAASIGPTTHGNNSACSCPTYASWNAYAPAPWGGVYGSSTNFAGPFFRGGVSTAMADCTDGLSNTIYFGEVRPMCSAHNQNGWGSSNNGQGLTSTIVPINYDSCDRSAVTADNCGRYCNWNTRRPASRHRHAHQDDRFRRRQRRPLRRRGPGRRSPGMDRAATLLQPGDLRLDGGSARRHGAGAAGIDGQQRSLGGLMPRRRCPRSASPPSPPRTSAAASPRTRLFVRE